MQILSIAAGVNKSAAKTTLVGILHK